MNVPPPEKRNAKITTSNTNIEKLEVIAASHPFTEQASRLIAIVAINLLHFKLDVIFPSNRVLEDSLAQLQSSYGKGKAKLSDVFSNASTFINSVEYQRFAHFCSNTCKVIDSSIQVIFCC